MSRCTISTALTQREEMLDRAVAALQQNRNDDAVELCRQLIDQDPDDAEAWSFFGVGVARSDFERGLESLRKAVQLEPSNAQWHLNLGMSLFQAGQYQLAESACRKAVELSKGVVDALVPWADALSALGRYGEAADVLEQVVQAEDSTMNRRRLAFVQEVLGDNKAALATLAPVFQAMESQSTDVLQRGRLHMQLLQLEDAASEFRALEPHAAGLPEVALHIAAYRRTCGDFAGAQDILGAAWEENRYPPLMAALLDDVNVEASWLDEADTFVQSESTPLAERRAITFALARALDQAGQADEAWEMATRANSLYEDTASFDVNTYRA